MPFREPANEPEHIELPPPRLTLLRRVALRIEQARALRGWVEGARGRSAALDATFDMIERDSRIGGGILAGALCYRLFVFALPLAVFLVSALGLLASALHAHPDTIVDSIGLTGQVTKQVEGAATGQSSWWVALSSFVVLVYLARVLLRALAIVHALAWTGSAASVKVGPGSLGIFGAAVVGQLSLVACEGAVRHQSPIGAAVGFVVFLAGLAGLWLVVSRELPHADAGWADLVPGSVFYAVGVVGVQIFNVLILTRLLEEKSSTYGALGIAAALLLGLFFAGRVMVGAAVLNATLYERRGRSAKRGA